MVVRLIRDAIIRQRMAYLFPSIQVFLFSSITVRSIGHIDPFAIAMVGAVLLSATTMAAFTPVMFNTLPIPRRTLWQSGWWLATVIPSAVAVLTVVVGQFTSAGNIDLGHATLSLAYCVLYTAIGPSLRTTRLGQHADAPVQPGRVMRVMVGALPLIIVIFGAPFLIAPYLPHTIAQVTAPWAIVGVAVAAFAARGYFFRPLIAARPSFRAAREDSSAPSVNPHPVRARAGFADRLTGIRLILWQKSRKELLTFSAVIALLVAGWLVASRFRPVPALGEFLRIVDALPFASRRAPVTEPITIGFLFFIAFMSDFGALVVSKIRSLRTLPLSTAQLSCIPAGRGLLSAAMLWVVLLALHALVLRTPPVSPRIDLFVSFAALTAMTRVLGYIVPGSVQAKAMFSLGPFGILWIALGATDTWKPEIVQPAMLIGGLLTLALSFALMRYAITRSSRLYRPQFTPVRFGS